MNDLPNIKLRSVTPADREILLTVYAASRSIELSMLPWNDGQKRMFVEHQYDAQTSYYTEKYPVATHDIILSDGAAAGRIYVDRRTDELAILDIAVLTEFRGQGIGTTAIKRLQAEAAATGRFVRVFVEVFNPSQKLFEELGFTVVADDGVNRRFEWRDTSV